jgi:signal transduction histidine kinase
MSFKLRFALQFATAVAVILLICFISIYFLYANHRQQDFYNRMRSEGLEVYRLLSKLETEEYNKSLELIREVHSSIISGEEIIILDSNRQVLFSIPKVTDTIRLSSIFQKINTAADYTEIAGNRQYIGLYLPKDKIRMVITGIDEPGLRRLNNLKLILLIVFGVALVITTSISFLFSNQVSQPLLDLSKQMETTSEVDLRKRIPENATFSEVNLVAKNFNAMLERLEKTFEFQRSFVHHASHELRTPLATMLSHTESALANRLTEEEYRIVLGSLKQDQERMIELTNSLLLISQFEQQGFDQSWPICRVDEILYDKISINMKMFPDMGISLVFLNTPSSDDDLNIRGNEALLKSMFSNLIRNGYYYSSNKKVEILLEITDEKVLVHVETRGEHLNETEKEKIMMPFYRGEYARQKKTTGAGLGLTIVQRILNMHKGSLTYSAMPHQVNRFTVILPKATTV